MEKIKIEDFIRQVQSELVLSETNRKRSHVSPLFKLNSFELEVNVTSEISQNGSIGLSVAILEGKGSVSKKNQKYHKIRLKFDLNNSESDLPGIFPNK